MRVASWEPSAGALVAFLDSTTAAYMVDLYTITLYGGAVLLYTSGDVVAVVNGVTYAKGPIIKRGKTRILVGIAVDVLALTMFANAGVTVNGTPLLAFITAGGFDGAAVKLERAFAAKPGGAWKGTLNLFQGRIAPAVVSRYEANLTVNSVSELLNVMVPRNVYQPGCTNTLYDGACQAVKATFQQTATAISSTNTAKTSFLSNLTQADGYHSQGFAVGVTGANAGVGRTIKQYSNAGGTILTIQPWPSAVSPGDTFTVYPGCDKTKATCNSKFSNLIHFRGYPYIPAPESIA